MGTPQKSLDAQLADSEELNRKKSLRITALEKQVQQLQREEDTAAAIRQAIFNLAAHDPKPIKGWGLDARHHESGDRGGPIVFWSDWHYGEVVEPEQLNGVNKFNKDIAATRAKRLYETTVDLCFEHMGRAGKKYPGIVVCLGGDMISGNIHEELANTNDRTPEQAVNDLSDILATGIEHMADKFGRVRVVCVVGNHGRSTKKPPKKLLVFHNYDWVIYCNLRRYFRNDKRIEFLIPGDSDAYFEVHGHRYLLTHGDTLGVRGGDGIIGAVGPIIRGAVKVGRSEAQIGRDIDTVLMGHWHQYLTLPGIIVNGTLKGYDEYAKNGLRLPYARPSQALWFTHPKHGITAHWQIYLEGQKTAQRNNEWLRWREVVAT